jgi:peptide/nickel transport system permease protein
MNQTLLRLRKIVTFNLETKLGFSIVAAFILISIAEAIGGRAILPYDPIKYFVGKPFSPPSLAHPFGTTNLGADLFSMVIAGAPNAAEISFFVVGVAFVGGGLLGAFAGYLGGLSDEVLMRVTDIFLTLPIIIIAMAFVAVLGPSPFHAMIALSIIWWPAYARLSRSEALKLRGAYFVESARLSNMNTLEIVFRHIFRVSIPTLLTYVTLDIGTVVLVYSGLSFLGLSVRLPYPDWGFMVANFAQYIFLAPWMPILPAVVIVLIAVGFSLLGDGMRSAIQQESR